MRSQSHHLKPAQLAFTEEQVPYSTAFQDIYHSKDGGLAQARNVFIAGNDLPRRWQRKQHFSICETGFGLGLSFLAAWQKWREDDLRSERLHFVSCELHPFTANDLSTLYAHLFARENELASLGEQLIAQWPPLIPGFHRIELDEGKVVLTLLFGDAFEKLCQLAGKFDAFFLDGFAPSKNPDLWQVKLFKQFARLAAKDATLATYTVAGDVRRALTEAGFVVEKRPGFGSKRQMLTGAFRGHRPAAYAPETRHAIVIGAGMAGAAICERLAQRGWRITVLEGQTTPAQGASGNHVGAYRPIVSLDDNLQARLARAAFFYGLRQFARLDKLRWQQCGAIQLAQDEEEATRLQQIATDMTLHADDMRWLSVEQASEVAGATLRTGGLYFPRASWIKPTSLVESLLAKAKSHCDAHYQASVDRIESCNGIWIAYDATGKVLAQAPVLILANAADATRFAPELAVEPDQRVVTHLPATAVSEIKTIVCRPGYVTPAVDGISCLGSEPADALNEAAHQANVAMLNSLFSKPHEVDTASLNGRLCARPNSIDRMPIIGQLADGDNFQLKHAGSLHLAPRKPGLFAITGFGARGLLWCSLMAETLASMIAGEPLPIERDLLLAVDPARFLARRLIRESQT